MKLSFVIPAYNEQDFLGNCLDSVSRAIAGRWQDFEIIVVNNASTDRTAEVALAHPRVKLINEPRKSLSQARQSGFEASSGQLIANVDADCILPEGWIETVLQNFSSNPKLVGLSGPHIFYDLSKSVNLGVNFYYRIGLFANIINRFVLRTGSILQGGNYIIPRWALEKIGGFNPAFHFYGEDTDMARRLHKIGDVKFTLKLPILASARRLKSEGILTMMIRYPLNVLWTNFFGRPFTQSHVDVRSADKKNR